MLLLTASNKDEDFKKDLLYFMCECFICMCVCAPCPWPGAQGSQKCVSDPFEPELQVVVSCHVEVGTESRFSVRISTFNH